MKSWDIVNINGKMITSNSQLANTQVDTIKNFWIDYDSMIFVSYEGENTLKIEIIEENKKKEDYIEIFPTPHHDYIIESIEDITTIYNKIMDERTHSSYLRISSFLNDFKKNGLPKNATTKKIIEIIEHEIRNSVIPSLKGGKTRKYKTKRRKQKTHKTYKNKKFVIDKTN